MLRRLKQQVFADFRTLSTDMTIKIVNWFYFRRSGVGPNLCIFHCFWHLAETLSVKWMTHSAPRNCISLLAVRQKCEAVHRANWVMQGVPRR